MCMAPTAVRHRYLGCSHRQVVRAEGAVIDLNPWHHVIHQVTDDMALRFNRVGLGTIAEAMTSARR
jgi:hypothetical protein